MTVSFQSVQSAPTGAGSPPASLGGKSTPPDAPALLAETPRGASGKPNGLRFEPCLLKGETFWPVTRGVVAAYSTVITRLTRGTFKESSAFFADLSGKSNGLQKLGTLTFTDAHGKQQNARVFVAVNKNHGLQPGAVVISTGQNVYSTPPITKENPVITNYGAPFYRNSEPPVSGPAPVTVGQLGANILDKFGQADGFRPISYSPEKSAKQAAVCKDQ